MPEKFDVDAARNRLDAQISHGLKDLPHKLLVESATIAASFVGPYYGNKDGLAKKQIDVMNAFSKELLNRLRLKVS